MSLLKIFPAIKYLYDQKLNHSNVSATSIRIYGRLGRILLGKCVSMNIRGLH